MKQLVFFITVLSFFVACNSNDNGQISKTADIDTREKSMKDDIEKFPDSIVLKENLVQYYRENGSLELAIGVINHAIQKDSNNPRLWDIKATLHFEDEDTLNAINAFEKAIDIYPDPSFIMSVGSLYAQTKNSRALAMADALMAGSNANTAKEAIFIKGLYYNYMGDKKKAITFFDNCLAIDYTFMFAYREKGIALFDLGKFEDALAVFDKAVTLQNNFEEGYYWMGRCFEKLFRQNDAIESYRTALAYDPLFIEAKEALARLGAQ